MCLAAGDNGESEGGAMGNCMKVGFVLVFLGDAARRFRLGYSVVQM